MFSCPLATPSNTLWLTDNQERYWRRFYLAIGLSVGLHICLAAGIGIYQWLVEPEHSITLNSGTPDLPIRVQIVTESSQQSAPIVAEPLAASPDAVVTTSAKTGVQTAHAAQEPQVAEPAPVQKKVVPEKAKVAPKKIAKNPAPKNAVGAADTNAVAGAVEKSVVEGANEVVSVSTEPRFRSTPQPPQYPMQARRRKQQGTVMINFILERNGSISAVNIQGSSGFPLLDNSAINAVKKWKLFPHKINGVAVRANYQVPVIFNLVSSQ